MYCKYSDTQTKHINLLRDVKQCGFFGLQCLVYFLSQAACGHSQCDLPVWPTSVESYRYSTTTLCLQ